MPNFPRKKLSALAKPFYPKQWPKSSCLTEQEPLSSSGSSHPPDRLWIILAEKEPQYSCAFTVMSYNILSDKYVSKTMKKNCASTTLAWKHRKEFLLEEIMHYKTDIISLQEVETEQYYKYFLPELNAKGYDGIFAPKSRSKTMEINYKNHVDGCAIFYKDDKFSLVTEKLVEFRELATKNAKGSYDMLHRVKQFDNIGLAALLQTKPGVYESGSDMPRTQQTLLVCNTHIHWDPQFSDVKLIQTVMLMHELKSFVDDILKSSNIPVSQKSNQNVIPLLLCGDFNSVPDSGVIECLSSGTVSTSHRDFMGFDYKDCLSKFVNSTKTNEFTHPFQISRAYKEGIMPFTNCSYNQKLVIDYVFYSKLHMSVLAVLGPIDSKWLEDNHISGSPQPGIPSDHLPIVVKLQLNRTLPIQQSLPNGLILHR